MQGRSEKIFKVSPKKKKNKNGHGFFTSLPIEPQTLNLPTNFSD